MVMRIVAFTAVKANQYHTLKVLEMVVVAETCVAGIRLVARQPSSTSPQQYTHGGIPKSSYDFLQNDLFAGGVWKRDA